MLSNPDSNRWRITLPEQATPQPLAMLVDDAPDVLSTTGRFLEAAGFDVVRATDGQAALASLASGRQFRLLVTDYAMPGLNGIELTVQAQEKIPDLKTVIITGFPDAEDFDKLPPDTTLLIKPFRRKALIDALRPWFEFTVIP
jgi:CheY-like chemotaxis protein